MRCFCSSVSRHTAPISDVATFPRPIACFVSIGGKAYLSGPVHPTKAVSREATLRSCAEHQRLTISSGGSLVSRVAANQWQGHLVGEQDGDEIQALFRALRPSRRPQ